MGLTECIIDRSVLDQFTHRLSRQVGHEENQSLGGLEDYAWIPSMKQSCEDSSALFASCCWMASLLPLCYQ